MSAKFYRGQLDERQVSYDIRGKLRIPKYTNTMFTVTVNFAPLAPRRDVIDYTEGFAWGGTGDRGEYQLAVAILTDAYGPEVAKRYVTQFARGVVRKLSGNWTLSEADVFAEILDYEAENRTMPTLLTMEPTKLDLAFRSMLDEDRARILSMYQIPTRGA